MDIQLRLSGNAMPDPGLRFAIVQGCGRFWHVDWHTDILVLVACAKNDRENI
jgi:hypothetical protein